MCTFATYCVPFVQVEWLKALVDKVPIRLVFESALELMGCTQIGTFQVSNPLHMLQAGCLHLSALPAVFASSSNAVVRVQMDPSGKSKGPPPAVKKVYADKCAYNIYCCHFRTLYDDRRH